MYPFTTNLILYFSIIPLIEMNHACISVEFSVFFIAKMHDSKSFSEFEGSHLNNSEVTFVAA